METTPRPSEHSIPRPPIDTRRRTHRQLVAGFRVYLTGGGVSDHLPVPQAYTAFRGIPVASDARVVDADESQATFRLSQYQANVVAQTRFALIHSPLHGTTFRAWTRVVDADARLASFTHFEQQKEGARRRVIVRVAPDESIPVRMRFGRKRVEGTLLDVSVVAIAAFVRDADPALLCEGAECRAQVKMPAVGNRPAFAIDTDATITRILAWAGDDPNDFRVVLAYDADTAIRERVTGYILEEQTRILQALSAGQLQS